MYRSAALTREDRGRTGHGGLGWPRSWSATHAQSPANSVLPPAPQPQATRTPPARARPLTARQIQHRRHVRTATAVRRTRKYVKRQMPEGTARDENYISQKPLRRVPLTGSRREWREVGNLMLKAGWLAGLRESLGSSALAP